MSSRDLPHSLKDAVWGWAGRVPDELALTKAQRERNSTDAEEEDPELREAQRKVQMKNLWPAFISGAGLFSDGYVNNSISTVTTCLSIIYGEAYTNSNAISNVSAIAFAGTVLGQLSFGYISDHFARKGGMLAANIMLIFFTICCAVATWGKTPEGLFAAITTFRFFLGIAIGAEYPTSSVIASEFANQLPAGHRNRYFCWFTNSCIDVGYVVSAFVPMVLLWIFSPRHLRAVWRLTLGLGVFPPLALFFMRRKMKNSESYEKTNMKTAKKFPWWLVIKFYWFRLTIVSIVWFIYDFSAYSFGLYSSYILNIIIPDSDLYKTFGWNVVFNLFYLPGTILGGFSTDYFGPRLTMAIGLFCQGIIGFGMTAGFGTLKHQIGGFVVVYGIFSALGEFGAGNNVGCLASKTSSTPVRGQYYGIAAAIGKVGAFVGTYVFPVILKNNGGSDSDAGIKTAFYVSSSLCLFSACLTLFFCPSVGQEAINEEDRRFVSYLKENGYDISSLGNGTIVHDFEESGDSILEKKTDNEPRVRHTAASDTSSSVERV
uniref:Major facilitator superfamily (MFS) profile domain-containing protein n=1 Tax=Candidozyma auris TaxID=498019 RepID=A0A0L0P3W5_CANAR